MPRDMSDFATNFPQPGDDPVERLRHTMAVFNNEHDDEWVLTATSGVYGPGVRTSLTRGDLRALLAIVDGGAR